MVISESSTSPIDLWNDSCNRFEEWMNISIRKNRRRIAWSFTQFKDCTSSDSDWTTGANFEGWGNRPRDGWSTSTGSNLSRELFILRQLINVTGRSNNCFLANHTTDSLLASRGLAECRRCLNSWGVPSGYCLNIQRSGFTYRKLVPVPVQTWSVVF